MHIIARLAISGFRITKNKTINLNLNQKYIKLPIAMSA